MPVPTLCGSSCRCSRWRRDWCCRFFGCSLHRNCSAWHSLENIPARGGLLADPSTFITYSKRTCLVQLRAKSFDNRPFLQLANVLGRCLYACTY